MSLSALPSALLLVVQSTPASATAASATSAVTLAAFRVLSTKVKCNKKTKTRQLALIFPTGVARHPERHAMVSSVAACYGPGVAYGLATAHALLCIVNGDDSTVFRFLSLVTLTFDC